jgi:hypothetical protein
MLSPKRASRVARTAAVPAAARAHTPMRAVTTGSDTCPATVLRATPSRVTMWPNSRSPCAAWLRFMKSMSMLAQGSSTLAWVCRCSSGLPSAASPAIHILAGENVCIHAITPRQVSSAVASRHTRRIAPASVSTGFHTTSQGISPAPSSRLAICRACPATWRSTSSPYRCWLPVRNQILPGTDPTFMR